jgi:hypothetical protein
MNKLIEKLNSYFDLKIKENWFKIIVWINPQSLLNPSIVRKWKALKINLEYLYHQIVFTILYFLLLNIAVIF